jgi:hypothetical protein
MNERIDWLLLCYPFFSYGALGFSSSPLHIGYGPPAYILGLNEFVLFRGCFGLKFSRNLVVLMTFVEAWLLCLSLYISSA